MRNEFIWSADRKTLIQLSCVASFIYFDCNQFVKKKYYGNLINYSKYNLYYLS